MKLYHERRRNARKTNTIAAIENATLQLISGKRKKFFDVLSIDTKSLDQKIRQTAVASNELRFGH